ncbi:MAG: RNA polymerase factor sigma-54 [Gammaproteobacteria bacterium]|nr:RNA polymerase factor sigma-54 [Gammaproteobacteria bacterium]
MKPSIQLRLGQQLTMTPQLQQAIRLLQLSTLELQAEIQQNFENNPMLETVEDDGEPEGESNPPNGDATSPGDAETAAASNDDSIPAPAETPDDLPVDSSWDDSYDTSSPYNGASDDGRDIFENQSGAQESLRDHLLWQMRLTQMSDTDRAIAMALIDAIGDDGYLGESLESIHANLALEADIDLDEVEAVLHLVQRFDPVGSGARSLSECLGIQLQQLASDTPWLKEARQLVTEHLDLLGARNYKQLSRRMKLTEPEVHEVAALIQTLNPRPGSRISSRAPEYIVPDVSVFRSQGTWRVELNANTAPRIRINSMYAGLVKRADNSADNTYMRNQLQEARWFIKSLQSRNETLLKVATAIVAHQRGFLEYGAEAMKPLVLKDIAERLEMHESTISRVTTHKYMHTPRGIFEFKYFFSSHVGTADGGVCSATAIRAMIKTLIAQEHATKPLSDSKIAAMLVVKGINVARRTVAKYREAMSIPPSNERKRMA